MNEPILLPKVKSVKSEPVYYGIRGTQYITRVTFRDGRAVTLQGELSKKEAYYQAYLQRALDAGLSYEEATTYAQNQYLVPIKKGA